MLDPIKSKKNQLTARLAKNGKKTKDALMVHDF